MDKSFWAVAMNKIFFKNKNLKTPSVLTQYVDSNILC